MGLDATRRRRRLGSLMLLVAVSMLVGGQTILKNRLKDFSFLLYWFFCFLFTAAAIFVAYMDMVAVQRRSRREARELLDATLTDIQKDAQKKPRNPR
jgi:hypothetical protein